MWPLLRAVPVRPLSRQFAISHFVASKKSALRLLSVPKQFGGDNRLLTSSMACLKYPSARRSDVKDSLHGKVIEDPYRWMEDPDAAETKEFVEAQNVITKKFLADCPFRDQIRQTLTDLWNYPKFSSPYRRGDYYYYHHNDGLQNQYVLYRKKELNGKPEVFLDPNLLSKDGTISLSTTAFSENDAYFAYSLSEQGSDWCTIHVRETKTKTDLPEKLERFRHSSIAWTNDEKGFFYGQFPDFKGKACGTETKVAENQKIFYHRLNTSQDKDVLCVEFPKNPLWLMAPIVSDCGKYLMISVSKDCKGNQLYIADISAGINGLMSPKCIQEAFDCIIEYITNDGDIFYFRTNKNRQNHGIVKVDISKPDQWADLVAEHTKDVIDWVDCASQDKLVVAYMRDVVSVINVYELQTGKFLQTLPFDIGTIYGMSGRRKYSEVFFKLESFNAPGIIYRCEMDKAPKATLQEHSRLRLAGSTTTDDLAVKQVFYESKDNTKVPMFIVRKKDSPLDGSSPCFLYIYGGFNCSLQPYFSVFRLMLMKALGFTLAIANVRGGGEYGERWHNAGRLNNKQNTFDDVHAAAKYLADNGYTTSKRLVLTGASNGGMVTTASINQRPELFGAAVAMVPVTDMFRFHKFTAGQHWSSDFGDPDMASDFAVQFAYSPLHNVPKNIDNYPSLLVTTADHDDRVVPSHSLKYIAEVQHRLGATNKNPLLALIDTKAGHGAGKPTTKIIEELVDIMCFLHVQLGLTYNKLI